MTPRDVSISVADASYVRRQQQQQQFDDRQLVGGRRQSSSYGVRAPAMGLMSREVNVPREGFCQSLDKTMDRLAETSKTIDA